MSQLDGGGGRVPFVLLVGTAAVTDDDLSRYRRDGYIVVRSAVDAGTVEAARRNLARLRSSPALAGPIVAVAVDGEGTPSDPWLAGVARDRRLVDLAEGALGRPVVCFGCSYIAKGADGGLPALWHQDGYPWAQRLGIAEAVTLWVALDQMDAGNGAMEVVPGSHAQPAQPNSTVTGPEGGLFGGGLDPALVARMVEPSAVRVLTMSAGDLSVHHSCLVHGSGVNRSGRERRALVVRYRPA